MSGYYIKIGQDGIGRLTPESPAQLLGLGTDGLQTCLGIALIGHNGRISLIHKSEGVSFQFIQQEITWAAPLRACYIVRSPYHEITPGQAVFIEKLKSAIAPVGCQIKWATEFFINKMGQYQDISSAQELKILPPFIEERAYVNIVNAYFAPQGNAPLDVQFDGQNWLDFPSLTEHVSYISDTFKNKADLTLLDVENLLSRWATVCRDGGVSTDSHLFGRISNGSDSYINSVCHQAGRVLFEYLRGPQRQSFLYEKFYVSQKVERIRQITDCPFVAVFAPDYATTAVCFFDDPWSAMHAEEKLRIHDFPAMRHKQVRITHQALPEIYYISVPNLNIFETS